MKPLNNKELQNIQGGVNWTLVTVVTAAISLLAGIFEGQIKLK